ncbi:hypothetical protein PR202_gb02685 [Eleusine coracana subsp. coracana]|uniref:Uncharacterized protein n=1 Tax=Eleusine coracana subsp. coracana TaxID=191504 RepID=A0AAV5DZX4_ELECO|nr:hypothetical protein PR202_gb02685 [Eleusine coracana subsp. coracana]
MPALGTKAGAVPSNGTKPATSSAGGGVGGGGRSHGDMGGDGRKEEESLGIRCDGRNETKPAASSAGGGAGGGGLSDGDMGGDRCDGSKGTKPAAGRAGGGGGGGRSDGDMSGGGGESESYTTWYDDFVNLETTRNEDYKKIVKNLSQYNGWKAKVNGQDGNGLLQETLDYLDYKTGKPVIYEDTVEDLLRLLRNSRQHSSRYWHSHFALVVGQHFPNLLSDFQGELFKVGCIELDLE